MTKGASERGERRLRHDQHADRDDRDVDDRDEQRADQRRARDRALGILDAACGDGRGLEAEHRVERDGRGAPWTAAAVIGVVGRFGV